MTNTSTQCFFYSNHDFQKEKAYLRTVYLYQDGGEGGGRRELDFHVNTYKEF